MSLPFSLFEDCVDVCYIQKLSTLFLEKLVLQKISDKKLLTLVVIINDVYRVYKCNYPLISLISHGDFIFPLAFSDNSLFRVEHILLPCASLTFMLYVLGISS